MHRANAFREKGIKHVYRNCEYLKTIPGKRDVAEERFKNGLVFERLGTTVKTTNFVAGEYTECIGLMRSYPNMKTAAAMLEKLANDAEAKEAGDT